MPRVSVRFERLPHGRDLPAPEAATVGSAGHDLRAAVDRPLTIERGGRALVPTALAMALPPGWEGQVRPRSGLATKHGITVLNAPGTIDSDYRGEIKVILVNLGDQAVTIERGERIAQLVIAPVATVSWLETDDLEATDRGAGGFGSTGLA